MKKSYDNQQEQRRLQELKSYNIINTLPQQELDALTRLAASICQTPVALITLVDEEHVWIKSKVGTDADVLSREDAFCSLAIEQDDIFEVPDAAHDPRFDDNPLVTGDESIRFYAGAPLVNEEGFALGMLCVIDQKPRVINDEQKKALKALSKFAADHFELRRTKYEAELNRNRYLKMIEDAGDVIYTCSLDGLFTYINPRVKNLIGHRAESIVGKHFTHLIADEWKTRAVAFYGEQFRNRVPITVFEFPINAGDGSLRWVEQTVTLSLKDGVPGGFEGIVRDIQDRKAAEEQLARVRRSKEDFLADMSHEIRTPLNAVLGFAELMTETGLNTEQAEYVNAIATSGKNLLSLCNDILDYSKIEAGMMRFETVPLGLKSLFGSLAVLFREKAREKKIDVDFTVADGLPATIHGDPTRLTQIIINLVSNALKFTAAGYVKIHAECAGETDETLDIRLTVRDSGIGIPKDKLELIFGRFSQASGDTTRKYGGSGLGLNIVKSLVELQGGTVSVKSRINEGSEFIITMPFRKFPIGENIAVAEEQLAVAPEARALRILIMEDNRLNQVLISKVISGFGFVADIASTGKEGIGLLQKSHYDLILMDMQMPVMNGYDATKMIRKEMKMDVPIIAMTAHILPDELEHCLKAGMNDHIGKPFQKEELYNKIIRLITAQEPVAMPEAEAEKTETGLIDLSQVKAMADGDPGFISQVLDLFIKDVPRHLTNIEEGLRISDYPLIKTGAHTLKSSMNLFGLKNLLGDLLIKMEDLARERKPLGEIEPLYAVLKNTGRRVVQEATQLRMGF